MLGIRHGGEAGFRSFLCRGQVLRFLGIKHEENVQQGVFCLCCRLLHVSSGLSHLISLNRSSVFSKKDIFLLLYIQVNSFTFEMLQ